MFTRMKAVGVAVLAAAGLAGVIPATSAEASVGCYGDYCSGQDPQATGCAADAQTVAFEDLSGARIEVRWSPTCKTNWARWQQYPVGFKSDLALSLVAIQDTGYSQSASGIDDVNGTRAGTYWTPMIYSPVHKVKAAANLMCGDATLIGAAFDCATNGKIETRAV
ncbi:Protein of unknown function [Amycolatopsis tolypomycina]|uniref:DUF2690 domain-containing protein n=1 Tax=Amycolatopsis tolypomycina TaxID=208445 RepID=A0A1H4JHH0_9PSEU|nr:DUF2690 domain-containing protein [Amycolatopsis tolypomycina]SEB45733.1 Protein of unknown function [Amycolatopsis tolypomycina]